jgi:uncharacterized lipoprotein YmbA
MLKTPFFHLSSVFAVIMLVVISGCAGKSQPPRFYTLTSIAEGNIFLACDSPAGNAAIGIGPVKLADYLDQSRIITRSSDNRVERAEFNQWSGSFKDNLTNVLAENIGYLLATDRIAIYPWRTYVPIDYQVTVDIVRCDGQPGKEVVLVARWSVLSGNEEAGNGGYESLVAAQSRALGRLSQEIVQTIQDAARKQQASK